MIGSAVSRLSQRLDEIERAAQAAGSGQWAIGRTVTGLHNDSGDVPPFAEVLIRRQVGPTELLRIPPDVAGHIARHGPEAVLNEVEVGRRIIELWREARGNYERMADTRARSMAPTKPEPSDLEKRWMDQADAYEKVIELLVTPQPVVSGGLRS